MNLEKINVIKRRIKELQAQLEAEGEEALKEVYAEFFANNPVVTAVQWEQYTPYWCDGGPCNFYVHDASLQFGEDEDFVMSIDGGTEEHQKAFDDLVKIEAALPEDLLLMIFGDHAQITVTKEGFDIEEFEHD